VRPTLVTALSACVDKPQQSKARHFLSGLSCDELQFIAEYVGSCILDSARMCCCSREQLVGRIAAFQRARQENPLASQADQEHKMILLLEFLCRSGMQQLSVASNIAP
jgi:hypothetical protein